MLFAINSPKSWGLTMATWRKITTAILRSSEINSPLSSLSQSISERVDSSTDSTSLSSFHCSFLCSLVSTILFPLKVFSKICSASFLLKQHFFSPYLTWHLHVLCSTWGVFVLKIIFGLSEIQFFPWNSNLTGCPVFYLATLLLTSFCI